ncbi:MAG: FHA domain-containing protein [Woeseiaceae bacterium]
MTRKSDKPAGLPTLQLLRNGEAIQELLFDVPRLLIGRSNDNDMSIPSRYVSRHHILLVRHGGSTILIDLNSSNGTFVNSKRAYNRVLANDDEITVDLHSLFVQYSIKYADPSTTAHGALDQIESVETVIEEALVDIGNLPGEGDTDLLPTLSENVPTELGIIDDR